MYKDKRILAVIPARGGSKGMPRKNVQVICGRPLVAWTIQQAQLSKNIDTVHVSTDDEEIATLASQMGVDMPFMRPAELARDESPVSDAIIYVLDRFQKLGREYDIVAMLEPTTVLRKKGDIDKALRQFVDALDKADSLVSLGEVHMEHPYICKTIDHGLVRPIFEEEGKNIFQRQQLPKLFFPYAVIYASKVSTYKQVRTFHQTRTIGYLIERWQNYEIDDILDFKINEMLLQQFQSEVM